LGKKNCDEVGKSEPRKESVDAFAKLRDSKLAGGERSHFTVDMPSPALALDCENLG